MIILVSLVSYVSFENVVENILVHKQEWHSVNHHSVYTPAKCTMTNKIRSIVILSFRKKLHLVKVLISTSLAAQLSMAEIRLLQGPNYVAFIHKSDNNERRKAIILMDNEIVCFGSLLQTFNYKQQKFNIQNIPYRTITAR